MAKVTGVREIIRRPQQLSQRLKRVRIERLGVTTDDELVERLKNNRQFLCVVNARAHAARLFRELHQDRRDKADKAHGLFHLSTLMCGAHRASVIGEIRRRLSADEPCGVVSTQLIEAGVDLDFPVVYRALAGIDSIAQAAGRCNREGRMALGLVYLFEPAGERLQGFLKSTATSTRELLRP
jgi:CRISPR-associated endonuclease/helicase Cas3